MWFYSIISKAKHEIAMFASIDYSSGGNHTQLTSHLNKWRLMFKLSFFFLRNLWSYNEKQSYVLAQWKSKHCQTTILKLARSTDFQKNGFVKFKNAPKCFVLCKLKLFFVKLWTMETICPIFKLPYQIHLSRLASLLNEK